MTKPKTMISRRTFTTFLAAGLPSIAYAPHFSWAQQALLVKTIPSTGEQLPVVGLGSWITFNVGRDRQGIENCTEVIRAFFAAGGRLIDSSPMYGSSQATIGYGLEALGHLDTIFATDKVWTNGKARGRDQIRESLSLWGLPQFSLLQVHNLRDWQNQLPTLLEMKQSNQLKYVGITTSHQRRHGDVETIMKSQPIDFVQLTYNAGQRAAESRLLPLARERGIAVILNRPFGGGRLIRVAKRSPFPDWARAEGLQGWPDFLLKSVVSHPAVTCAIPATSRADHVRENMLACRGELPSARLRQRMLRHIEAL